MAYTKTQRDEWILEEVKNVMPTDFIASADDRKILGFVDLVVNDLNWFLPMTNYNRSNYPDNWRMTVVLGANVFAQMFKQMEVTLEDFGYSDSGLSVTIDQVGKLNVSYVNMLKVYQQQAEFIKKAMLLKMGVGMGTPRYQSQIGQFLKIALGSCVFGFSEVLLSDCIKQIKDILIGDLVLSHDGNFHEVIETICIPGRGEMISAWIDGKVLSATGEHPIYIIRNNEKIWCPIREVTLSDKSVVFDRTKELHIPISKLEMNIIDSPVYNLEVKDSNSYNISGIIVHNSFNWGS